MKPLLFDPLQPPPDAWPAGRNMERRYIERIARLGVSAMVTNVRTHWLALRSGGRVFPVTVNEGERGGSYVCLPHSAYVLYGRRELELVDVGLARPVMLLMLAIVDQLLRTVRINRTVHVDNWLLSTNLHGDWDGGDLPAIRSALQQHYPKHHLAIRSLDPWSAASLYKSARADGWLMLPSRQVWVVDELVRDWRPRKTVGHDRRLIARSELSIENLLSLRPGDAERIAHLYKLLYVDKYSGLNPTFTPAWIACTHADRTIHYRVARDGEGVIQSVAGSLVRDGILTPPVVGYNTARPRAEGLYRIASYMFSQDAEERGARLHSSAGAADFKRIRGARPVIECMAIYPASDLGWRLWLLRVFSALLWYVAVPLMQRRQL